MDFVLQDLTKSVVEFTMHLERLVIATEQLRENDLPFHHMSVSFLQAICLIFCEMHNKFLSFPFKKKYI